jgi:hypothetical protein
MSLKLGKPKMPPSEPRKDKERETRKAIVQDADKTGGEDRDLVHGDGGMLGLGDGEDLDKNDLLSRENGFREPRKQRGPREYTSTQPGRRGETSVNRP